MQIYLIFFLEGHYFLDIQYLIFTINTFKKAVCTYGRENFESWGRKKREARSERAIADETTMSLSRNNMICQNYRRAPQNETRS